ncbi:enoyl-CoA hydratase [Burkholderia territorii]|uniref:Enoyl-CoA hydratase n=1 Tax=Burkholderia territorii TaxID=1503055 RepID=A0A6L3NHH3_9BURK|nr:enoyl-CoA hydratase [Burkholderia territorii]
MRGSARGLFKIFSQGACGDGGGCIESRLFRANGNAARGNKGSGAVGLAVEPPAHTKLNPGRRNEAVQKVVDEPRNAVHNLASLLLKTQRC